MRRTPILVCALVMVLVSMPVAEGHVLWHHDPRNDAEYDDLRAARLSTFVHGDTKMLRANADFKWHGYEVDNDQGSFSVRFVIDSRGDGSPDYALSVDSDGGSCGIIGASLRRIGEGVVDVEVHGTGDEPCLHLPVWIKMGALHPTRHIQWFVKTATDRMPSTGWYEH